MALMRLYKDFVSGTLASTLSNVGAEIEGEFLEDLPEIKEPFFLALTLDPEGVTGPPEIVHIVDHDEDADTAEVSRAQEDTAAREHVSGTKAVGAGTAEAMGEVRPHAATHAPGGGDALPTSELHEFHTNDEALFNSQTFTPLATISPSLPGAWSAWAVAVWATWRIPTVTAEIRIRIYGQDSQTLTAVAGVGGMVHFRQFITGTGNIQLLGRQSTGQTTALEALQIYARITRSLVV